MMSIMNDLIWSPQLRFHIDSSAAKTGSVAFLPGEDPPPRNAVSVVSGCRKTKAPHRLQQDYGAVSPADMLTKSFSILIATTPMEAVWFRAPRQDERGVKPHRWADVEDSDNVDFVHGKLLL
ncbi:unnamed protein product [Prorocentrum cordatum]|uniref:Phospholipase B-like n=1 Tax=Prorocentrum cordatum TaxID=2364126 RepID=A0ABN9UPX0_9DINO|nr:unnamed protein product [Polarella glacialis]